MYKPCIFGRESWKIQNKQVWSECHIIYFLSSLAWAALDNIGPWPHCALSVLPRLGPNSPVQPSCSGNKKFILDRLDRILKLVLAVSVMTC